MTVFILESRCQDILNILIDADEYYTIKDLMNKTNLARRSIYHNLKKINDWLILNDIEAIKIKRNKGIYLLSSKRKAIKRALTLRTTNIPFVFTPMERVKIIMLSIILSNKKLTINDLENITQVSRNTIINDLKNVEKAFDEYDLKLEVDSKKGYIIKGDVIKKRTVFFLNFYYLIEYYRRGIIKLDNINIIDSIYIRLLNIELALNTDFVRGVIFSISVYFAHILNGEEEISFNEIEKEEIMKTEVFEMVRDTFTEYKLNDQIYLSLHLLGSRLQSSNSLALDNNDEAFAIAENLVKEFMRISYIDFDNVEEIVRGLYYHLSTSIYRYRYGIQLANPLLDDIKREYEYIFEITKKACEYLRATLKVPIPESEVGYITLHFGGAIRSKNKEMSILVVCPNGLSISNMLKWEIKSLVPFVHHIECISLNEYDLNHNFDLVVSTVDINDDNHKILSVQPILTEDNRYQILKRCIKSVGKCYLDLNDILHIAGKYIKNDSFEMFKSDLLRYLSGGDEHNFLNKNESILHFLNSDAINICKVKVDYKAAIGLSCNYLLGEGMIEYRYIESIISNSEKMNHYMFLTPEVYLAHAKSEDGAVKLGVTLTLFKQPVEFTTSKQAKIIIALSTPDEKQHLKILGEIMKIFSCNECIENIIACNSKTEILRIIQKQLQEYS